MPYFQREKLTPPMEKSVRRVLGKEMKKKFLLEDETVFVNHGSYGAVPRVVQAERVALLEKMDRHPDRWFRNDVRPLYDEAVKELSHFVGAAPENIVFVTNATAGINTVLKSLRLEPGDKILMTKHTYQACAFAVESAVKRAGAGTVVMDICLPVYSEDSFVEQVVETCKNNAGIRLAMLDHISSPSAIVFPVSKLAKELHKLGILLLVDGAHAPGQILLDIENLGADFYVANLHKWCYAPRGCAFLWVAPSHRDSMEPLVTSHSYNMDMVEQFFMQGTIDHTPYLCVKAALKFYSDLGGHEAILGHIQPLLDWAQDMLSQAMDTTKLPVPHSMQAPFMRVIRLPIPEHSVYSMTREGGISLMKDLYSNHKVVAAVVAFSNLPWLRISANVYNCKDDYLSLRDTLIKCFEQ